MCSPETAAAEFEAAKVIYETAAGRSQPKDRDVTMYRVMQCPSSRGICLAHGLSIPEPKREKAPSMVF